MLIYVKYTYLLGSRYHSLRSRKGPLHTRASLTRRRRSSQWRPSPQAKLLQASKLSVPRARRPRSHEAYVGLCGLCVLECLRLFTLRVLGPCL